LIYEFPALWPLIIHLELLGNRKIAAFFCNKFVILVSHLGWCGVLHEWNHCRLILSAAQYTVDALFCNDLHLQKHVVQLHQDLLFSNVNTSVKQAKYEQEEWKFSLSLHDSWIGLGFHLYLDFLCLLEAALWTCRKKPICIPAYNIHVIIPLHAVHHLKPNFTWDFP